MRILLLKALFVRDGLLLDILDIKGSPELVVEIEDCRIGFFSQDSAKQLREFHRVVNSQLWLADTRARSGSDLGIAVTAIDRIVLAAAPDRQG